MNSDCELLSFFELLRYLFEFFDYQNLLLLIYIILWISVCRLVLIVRTTFKLIVEKKTAQNNFWAISFEANG